MLGFAKYAATLVTLLLIHGKPSKGLNILNATADYRAFEIEVRFVREDEVFNVLTQGDV
jgi:hypothetical protein